MLRSDARRWRPVGWNGSRRHHGRCSRATRRRFACRRCAVLSSSAVPQTTTATTTAAAAAAAATTTDRRPIAAAVVRCRTTDLGRCCIRRCPASPWVNQTVDPNPSSYRLTTAARGWLGSRVVSVLDSCAKGPGYKSQSRRCRVTVLGKLFRPIVPLFSKQQSW